MRVVVKPEAIKRACLGCSVVFMGHHMKRLNPVGSKASIYLSKFSSERQNLCAQEAEPICPACSNDCFSEVFPQVLMTLISLLGPTGEQACSVLSGAAEPEGVSHKW